ncbi:MAG: type II toxin-antitoxin system VapC family toxin [Candidatus Omnitrophica bacterium]|nr:type II toxin-antitoxin system VapC family toxin [Candidatus Omnitrophota bacterium]
MSPIFADTSYFIALMNERDELHLSAVERTPNESVKIITSEYVLVELLNSFSKPTVRSVAARFVRDLLRNSSFETVKSTSRLLLAGVDLFQNREDKEWSLTDCISFVIMREKGLTEALTSDHHFEQAGFVAHLIER